MIKVLFLLCILFSPLLSFNISNINDITKISMIRSASKGLLLHSIITNSYNDIQNVDTEDVDTEDIEYPNEDKQIFNHKHKISSLENNIYFYSPVNEESAMLLENKLLILNEKNKQLLEKNIDMGPINLHIQSFGGSLFHTIYLMDLIQNLDTPVHTYINGFAASAATLISIAGKRRYMTKHSLMLIHQLSTASAGKYSEIKDEMENNDLLMDMITSFYIERTHLNREILNRLLKRDIWLNSSKCLKYGLVDEII